MYLLGLRRRRRPRRSPSPEGWGLPLVLIHPNDFLSYGLSRNIEEAFSIAGRCIGPFTGPPVRGREICLRTGPAGVLWDGSPASAVRRCGRRSVPHQEQKDRPPDRRVCLSPLSHRGLQGFGQGQVLLWPPLWQKRPTN